MTKTATKTEIERTSRAAAPEGKFKVAAQGTTERIRINVRQRMGMGTRDAHYTKLQRNGRYMVTVWGKNAQSKMERIMKGLTAAGYTIETVGLDYFEVTNGTVLPLEGVLRYEGNV